MNADLTLSLPAKFLERGIQCMKRNFWATIFFRRKMFIIKKINTNIYNSNLSWGTWSSRQCSSWTSPADRRQTSNREPRSWPSTNWPPDCGCTPGTILCSPEMHSLILQLQNLENCSQESCSVWLIFASQIFHNTNKKLWTTKFYLYQTDWKSVQ